MNKSAVISKCGRYRYRLDRVWEETKGRVNFVMLNPSTADATTDDPTIRRCVAFARDWGYGGIVVTNLFIYRATSPEVLKTVGGHPAADSIIKTCAEQSDLVVAAWGNHGTLYNRGERVRAFLASHGIELNHLGLTKIGQPKHPLYLPKTSQPVLWSEGVE